MSRAASHSLYRSAGGLRLALLCGCMSFFAGLAGAQTVAQAPLSVAGDLPGNLVLVPSVEWPTVDSVSNLGDYDVTRSYYGYFDPSKCYNYSYSFIEEERHFYPVATTTTHTCDYRQQQWSGNYLNWAATPTIDPFRKALTGGHRVKDTTYETWLEKARYDDQGANRIYPNRRIPASNGDRALVRGATPADWDDFTYRIWTSGNRMRFTRTGNLNGHTIPYIPAAHTTLQESTSYEVSVRVKVCDPRVGLEPNCVQYVGAWKPEGLIQKYSERLRYSVFSYLNDSEVMRDGGVLRARQKFVGPEVIDPFRGAGPNPHREWDPLTGVLLRNPDSNDASTTSARVGRTIADSGVINYINKFGQMTDQHHKRNDPVSELYYAALRYLKHLGNVPEYSNLAGTPDAKYIMADGFPVITNWDDPMQYSCQSNALLGIGDVFTHNDKNLPGNTVTTGEPARPAAVTADTSVDVVAATAKVAELEGIAIATPFGDFANSAYIAGLAYDAHTTDLRPDLDGMQTASTYWVDVREGQVLEPRATNQYWLAAKYGGFEVPEDYDPYEQTDPLDAWLWSSGEVLSTGEPRPDTFFVASEADKMVESLTRAFAKVAAEKQGSGASLAANSTQLDSGTAIFQSQFYSGTWRGELRAIRVSSDGSLADSPLWRAGVLLASATNWSERQIYFYNPQKSFATGYEPFAWENLGSAQREALVSEEVVDYLRGDRSNEEDQPNGSLRTRTGVLGDIVSSVPVYVGKPNPRLYAASSFAGASSYADFAAEKADRAAVIYVGANDGMLHGFDAATGAETYAFVPNASIMSGLQRYSDPTYSHRYFVDGESAVADVYDTAARAWKSVLVGSMGRGGPGLFALDITDPADVKFLWELGGTEIAGLGKNIGRPVIAQVANGDWRVLLGNGPESATGSAQMIMIDVLTAAVTVVDTGVAAGNGLTAVLARDSDGDGFADQAYAGDLRGNLWKFRNLAGTPGVTKMFAATDDRGAPQPITAAPLVGKDPDTGAVWAFFGTGRYLGTADLLGTQVQTWYGIKDTSATTATRVDLVQRRIVAEDTIASNPVRAIDSGSAADLVGRRGWYIDLLSPLHGAEGERMVVPNRFQATALIGTTRIPEAADPCNPRGRGFIMAIDPFSGARLDLSFFDTNRDGGFDGSDEMLVDGQSVPASGVGFGSSPNNPIFVEDNMQTSLDDGTTETIKTQSPSSGASRLGWRELVN